MECECPVCHKAFKTPQGRGGHLLHAPDAAHALYRSQQQVAAVLAAQHAAQTAPVPAAPVQAAPAPVAPPASVVQPVPVAWPLPTRGLEPGAAWESAAPATPQAAPASPAPAPARVARDFLKPAGAALMGGALGAAALGASHRGVGFLFGAGAGLLVWWAIEQHRTAPTSPRKEAEPVVVVPPEWQGILVPGVGWSP